MNGLALRRDEVLEGFAVIFARRPDLRGVVTFAELLHAAAVSAA